MNKTDFKELVFCQVIISSSSSENNYNTKEMKCERKAETKFETLGNVC